MMHNVMSIWYISLRIRFILPPSPRLRGGSTPLEGSTTYFRCHKPPEISGGSEFVVKGSG